MGNIAEILNINTHDTAASKQASNYDNNLDIRHHLDDVYSYPCTNRTRIFCAEKNYREKEE